MDIHGTAVAEIIKSPYLVQQLVAGIHPVGGGCQMVQKLQLLGRRVDLLPVHRQLVGVQVDLQLVEYQLLLGILGDLRAAQDRIDAGNELLHFKGLDDIVVSTHLQALDTVKYLALGGDHNDRGPAGLTDLAAYRPAIHYRQHDIQQDHVRLHGTEGLHRRTTVKGRLDLKALFLQVHPDQVGNIPVILHH